MRNIKNVLVVILFLFDLSFGYEVAVFYQPSECNVCLCPHYYDPSNPVCDNWLYPFIEYVGTDVSPSVTQQPGWRVPRIYSERFHWVNGQSHLLNVWDDTDVNTEIDMMKQAGISHMIYLNQWTINTDPTVPGGFSSTREEIDVFVRVNQNRPLADQVKYSIMYAADGWIRPLENYADSTELINIWTTKIEYAITTHFNQPSYYRRNNMPMMTFWDTGSFMMKIKPFGVTIQYLLSLSQTLAQSYGYSGIYWLDSASTLVDAYINNPNGGSYTLQNYIDYYNVISSVGFSAGTGWQYHGLYDTNYVVNGGTYMNHGYNQFISTYSSIWQASISTSRNNNMKHFPTVSPGYDARPGGEYPQPPPYSTVPDVDRSRSCDGAFDSDHNGDYYAWGCSLDQGLFATMLRNARSVIDNNMDVTEGMVIAGTWNDVMEGHYIIPTVGDKGAHARVLYNVFTAGGWSSIYGHSVYYGQGSKFVTKTFYAGEIVDCSNAGFGIDPYPYVMKECRDQFGEKRADENGSFMVDNTLLVKFGNNGQFITMSVPLGTYLVCSYNQFGSDPLPGQAKACYDGLGKYLASEWQGFIAM